MTQEEAEQFLASNIFNLTVAMKNEDESYTLETSKQQVKFTK